MNHEEKILSLLEQMSARQDKMQSDISDIKTRVTKIEVTQENRIIPHIELLSEGHEVIQNQIKNLSVIDRMQEDIDILKTAVSYLSHEVKALREAM